MATENDPFSPYDPATKIPPAFPLQFYVLPSVVGTKIAMENDPFIDDLPTHDDFLQHTVSLPEGITIKYNINTLHIYIYTYPILLPWLSHVFLIKPQKNIRGIP